MDKDLFVVLMAGGVGVRFWPYSRNSKPKQFLDVLGTGKSLLQSTYERFAPICLASNIYVVTNEEHVALVKEQLPMLSDHQILKEPARKNTAPCIGYASYKIARENKNAVIVVSPSDHLILKEAEFQGLIGKVASKARGKDMLITLGINPTRPETGYGYIQYIDSKKFIKKVKTFTEKPELSLAKTFIESGDFVWNSGIFIWSVKAIIKAYEEFLPDMAEVFEESSHAFGTPEEGKIIRDAYTQFRNMSVDTAVMEKATNVFVVNGDFSWSDLGSWSAIHEVSKRDPNNNVVNGRALVYETRNSIIRSSSPDKLLLVQGLNGYLVGEFGNVLIVCEKDREDQFRKFVQDVRELNGGNNFL